MPLTTPEKQKTLLEKLAELPLRRYAQMLRSRVDDLRSKLEAPYFDQYSSRRVPAFISCLYQVNMTTSRRVTAGQGGAGFEALATLASPSAYILPRSGPMAIGRDRAFYWCRTALHGYINWTYTADPGFTISATNPKPVSDVFSSVFNENGGALVFDNVIPDATFQSSWSCDLHIYDKQQGRFLSEAPVPMEFFLGGTYANKGLSHRMRFEPGAIIEPRLYLKEFRPSGLDTDQAYQAASVRGFINLVFIGYQDLEQPINGEEDRFQSLPDVP